MITHANMKLYLDRNESMAGPAPECLEALREITAEEVTCYTRDFARGIKSRLSQRLSALHGIPEERVLLGGGSEDLIKQAVHCYLKSGDVLLKPELSWWYYDSVASEVGARTHTFKLRRGEWTFSFDVAFIIDAFKTRQPGLVLISSPNNPTGNSLSLTDLRTVLYATGNTVVVLDQAYHGFTPNNELPAADLLGEFPHLIVLRTFSKLYGLAGARIGYALAGEGARKLVKFNKKYLGFNRISEALALAALDAGEYYGKMQRIIAEEKEKYYADLGRLPGFTVYASDASFVLVQFDPAVGPAIRGALAQKNIVVKFFDDDDLRLRNHMRITIGTEEQNALVISTLMAAVEERKVKAA